ncbi:MAG: GDSL-type esterase/lipase family protein, partial [Kiritimatiellaeota bacterium]|nr:GDSL-type esterase/lipase family protein [Kiritimatiellota bacterium]
MKTTHTRFVFLAAVLSAFPLFANPPGGPTPFPDWHNEANWPGKGPIRVFGWMVDNRNWFWTQRERDQGAVVFVGDSLTGNWKSEQMHALFPGLKIANRGIGGDISRGLLFRFKEDVLDLHPRAVVICIGANDLSAHADLVTTEGNIAAMLEQARKIDAKMPIILCTVPPRDSTTAPTKPGACADLNARIKKLGEGQSNRVVLDLYAALALPDGKPILECFEKDRLHLAPPGYEKWAALLRPALEKLGVM